MSFNNLSDFDQGWIVGILDGEASFPLRANGRVVVELKMGDLDSVERYHHLTANHLMIRSGEDTRPTVRGQERAVMYRSNLYGQAAKLLMIDVFPYMSERRQLQIQRVLLP